MATFCNQSSNLSALSSALTSYSNVLDVSEKATLSLTRAEHQETAVEFLDQQQQRVEAIDAALLKATGHILPPSRDTKTVTELAEICRLVQEATRQKMGLLRTRLDLMGIRPSWHDSVIASPQLVVDANTGRKRDIHWSIGVPLDCVMEGDVETEGATTPGSLSLTSPFPSATKQHQQQRKTSLTPPTPTMNRFSFSTRTATIIEGMNQSTPGSSAKRPPTPGRGGTSGATPSPSLSQVGPSFKMDGFHDDDDMISLNTTAQDINPHHYSPPAIPSPLQTMKEERLQFIQRMESMLERVEEELIYESRPSDEMSRTSKTNVARKSRSLLMSQPSSDEQSSSSEKSGSTDNETDIRDKNRRMERPSNNKFLDELQGDTQHEDESSSGTENDDDDSTNLIATLVAEKPEPLRDNIQRPVPVFSRHPTHITVDNGAQSPAHTNITMDATMMNDTMISGMATMTLDADEDENGSVMTPVLDRYRLDPDDNSIGVKVVPNQRGMHNRYTRPTLPDVAERITTNEFYEDNDGFTSPKGLPGSVAARKTKQYRKTPYPKKQLERNMEDENYPNTPAHMFSPASSSSASSFDASNPESSFSVPPLRPRSFGPSRTLLVGTRSTSTVSRTQSLPVSSKGSIPNTPVPDAFEREP